MRSADFVRRLHQVNILVRPRFAADRDGAVASYSVALRPTSRDETIVWHGGGRLTRGLTLPRLRDGWPDTPQSAQARIDSGERPGETLQHLHHLHRRGTVPARPGHRVAEPEAEPVDRGGRFRQWAARRHRACGLTGVAALIVSMATITQPRTQPGVPAGGQFATADRTEGDIVLAVDAPACEVEARDLYAWDFPDASPEQFDEALFDTWDSSDDFEAYAADPDNEVLALGDRLRIEDLPSGGVVAFWA